MSKQASAIWAGAWDSIKSPMNVLKDLGKGDFSGAWKDLKHIPGNQERANSKTLNSFGIRGWVGDHPGETAAAIAGSILGGSALMGGGAAAGSGAAGASGSTAAPITAAVGTPVTQTGTAGATGTAGTAAASGTGSGIMGTMQNWAGYAQMGSSLLNASSSVKSGNQTASVYNQQAKQLRQQANNVDAAYQQQAREQTTQARQAESTSLANAAASGANANSVSAINNRADIAQQGELNNLMTLWNGTQQSNQMRNQASVLKAQAKSAKSSGGLGGLTSILQGGASLYSLYK